MFIDSKSISPKNARFQKFNLVYKVGNTPKDHLKEAKIKYVKTQKKT